MIKNGEQDFNNELLYVSLPRSEVSEAKKNTVNYKLTEGTQYYQEALENMFAHDSFADIRKLPVREYVPVVRIDDIYLWKHKSTNRYYACRSASNRVPEYNSRDSLVPFLRRYGLQLRVLVAEANMDYSDFLIKTQLADILK